MSESLVFSDTYQPERRGDQTAAAQHKGKMTRALIKAVHVPHPDGGKHYDRIAKALVDKAIEGDIQAIREVMDRVDGKVAQRYEGKTTQELSASKAFVRLLESLNRKEPPTIDVTPDDKG